MGYIKKQWILVEVNLDYDHSKSMQSQEKRFENRWKKWLNKLKEENRKFFFTNLKKMNGYMTIFMDWDGSKEGWETSNEYDEIRKSFIDFIKKEAPFSIIREILDDEALEVDKLNIIYAGYENHVSIYD